MRRCLPMCLGVLLFTTGCEVLGQSCNLMYAPDNVVVALSASAWPEGVWEVEAEGETCTVTLPGDGSDLSCSGMVLGVQVANGGAGLTSFSLFDAAPEQFDVVIRVDGVEVLSEVVTPEYVEDEPNGKGCGERQSGAANLTIVVE